MFFCICHCCSRSSSRSRSSTSSSSSSSSSRCCSSSSSSASSSSSSYVRGSKTWGRHRRVYKCQHQGQLHVHSKMGPTSLNMALQMSNWGYFTPLITWQQLASPKWLTSWLCTNELVDLPAVMMMMMMTTVCLILCFFHSVPLGQNALFFSKTCARVWTPYFGGGHPTFNRGSLHNFYIYNGYGTAYKPLV